MDIVSINGLRAVVRVAAVAAAMAMLSGGAWAQYWSGPSGDGPHTGSSSQTMRQPEMSPSGAGQGAADCSVNTVRSNCGESSGSSGNAASPSGDEGGGAGVNVNDLQILPRNDKIPSRRTDE